MNPLRPLFFSLVLGTALLPPLTFAAKPPASTGASAAGAEADYGAKIEARTDEIVKLLSGDAAAKAKAHDVILEHYRALNAWHETNDSKLKALAKQASDTAKSADAKEETTQIQASLKTLHQAFLTSLSAVLSPEDIEKVKDKMTYNKVEVTYRAYCEIIPQLNDEQKAKVLATLKEAREEAMDGGSSDEKSAIFKKYKGRIANYFSAQGIDEAKARKEWTAKQKTKTGAQPPTTN